LTDIQILGKVQRCNLAALVKENKMDESLVKRVIKKSEERVGTPISVTE
jgi:hypothetical protein